VASIQHESAYLYDPEHEAEDARYARLRPISRREAYEAGITYGTNNEFGFDFLRDNMVVDLSHTVQRPLSFAIVDEVDNILIDEARTPLIISGAAEEATQWYYTFAKLAPRLVGEQDYLIDEKLRAVSITEDGIGKMEKWLGIPNLYDPSNYVLTHFMENALKAHALFRRDRDYVVKDGQVIIVDEFTGRLMFGRRYSEGLHQAIEAKEGVKIQRESITLATITFQNYFRLYEKLAGMTGTAATEAEEFHKIYKLEVVVIPTHRPMIRADQPDLIFKTEEGKFQAVVEEIEELHAREQPVLVGTTSIEKSERLSGHLVRRGIAHEVLNAKYHEREAAIVAQAGRPGAVTIATNMAGRGTDIILGGNTTAMLEQALHERGVGAHDGAADPPAEVAEQARREVMAQWEADHAKVVEAGGLHITGTERHEARRIDNQLRGRSGRQGDPGSSRFYLSLEDDIMRRFGGDRIKRFMEWAGLEDDVPIEHGMVSKSIESAQSKVEGYNFDLRKHVVDYDDVMNKQREVIYAERRKILSGADLRANMLDMIEQEIHRVVGVHLADRFGEAWDVAGLLAEVNGILPLGSEWTEAGVRRMSRDEVVQAVLDLAHGLYEQKEADLGPENMRMLERLVMLRTIDNLWVQHLTAMDDMRQGIGLRAYGQSDPLVAYKREAHIMYDTLRSAIRSDVVRTIYHVGIVKEQAPPQPRATQVNRGDGAEAASGGRERVAAGRKVGRNDPCPCGSGRKYKRCHGA
ncbi:MAG: preprotein translocase subunit SecA, partial [Chloroflexi bacterium]|nr:preprotein translocase subunit SecA [Chloroflexota bacterium]